jgi:hypothetical protein
VIKEVCDELLELLDTVRSFVHMQQPRVPSGFPGIVACIRSLRELPS